MRGSFTLSYHYFTPRDARNHLELFLDLDGESPLETWRFYRMTENKNPDRAKRFSAAAKHRRIYLEFAGKIAGGRGKLRILRQGKFIDRRTRMSEVLTAQDVHPGANRRTRMSEPCGYIKVLL